MTIFLIVPWVVAVATAFILKNIHIKDLRGKSKLLNDLVEKNWFSDVWKNGALLFFSNLIISVLVAIMFLIIRYLSLSALFIVVISVGLVLTIVVWVGFRSLWNGLRKHRFTSALIGSSYYLIIASIFLLYVLQLEAGTIDDETTRRALTVYIGLYLSINAGSMCLVTVGLPSSSPSNKN